MGKLSRRHARYVTLQLKKLPVSLFLLCLWQKLTPSIGSVAGLVGASIQKIQELGQKGPYPHQRN